MKTHAAMIAVSARLTIGLSLALSVPHMSRAQQDEHVTGAPAERTDAAEVRAQIASIEKLLPTLPDRGAALYVMAALKQHLGETREALQMLKECVDLREGFEPSPEPAFRGLKGTKEFDQLVEKAQRDFPPVANARTVLVTQEKDLIPEGLAWDEKQKVFYLSSLNRRKIIRITPENRITDFVAGGAEPLLPVLGIRMDPRDGSVWAITADFSTGSEKSELIHADAAGKLLGRFAPPGPSKHGFNDLIVRRTGEVILTDTVTHQVFRFNSTSRKFSELTLHRPLFFPNGIAIADDDNSLFVADALGVLQVDLANARSRDVDPGARNTIAGADGMYWHKGSLVMVQNGIGAARIVVFRLAKDSARVSSARVLEYRSSKTPLPTTGAIRGSDFYFIENSQVDNLNGTHVMDITKLEPVRIAMVRLP